MEMKLRTRTLLSALITAVVFIVSVPVYADAGTPPLMPEITSLIIGNVIIGVIEGLITTWIADISVFYTIPLMILANISSAFIGILGFDYGSPYTVKQINPEISLNTIIFGISALFILLYILTIVIEYPFMRIAMLKTKKKLQRPWIYSLKILFIVNIVSYTWLILLFIHMSDLSVLTRTHYDPSASFLNHRSGHIYYCKPDKGIYCISLNDRSAESFIAPGKMLGNQIFALKSDNSNSYDLCTHNNQSPYFTVLKSDFSKNTIPFWIKSKSKIEINASNNCVDFRQRKKDDFKICIARTAVSGLIISSHKRHAQLGLFTPFGEAISRYGAVLPGNILIYELGGRIIALDLNNMHISQLAIGCSPVVTLD